jgi:hypothetical protein
MAAVELDSPTQRGNRAAANQSYDSASGSEAEDLAAKDAYSARAEVEKAAIKVPEKEESNPSVRSFEVAPWIPRCHSINGRGANKVVEDQEGIPVQHPARGGVV